MPVLLTAVAAMSCQVEPDRPAGVPPGFWKSSITDVGLAVRQVKRGSVRTFPSAGGRTIHLVSYGERDENRGTANYNSACAGRDPASYARKDGKQKPVVWFLGPVHGQELEGIAGLVNLLEVAETGKDLRGKEWAALVQSIARCRVLVVPCGNPDGRFRCKVDSWVGGDPNLHERAGMGLRADGTNFSWPQVKRIHPMRGPAVRELGAYFNDDGVNLMHDEWFSPMAPETREFFKIAREEAPDYIVSLHSHLSRPGVEPTELVPRTVKVRIKEIADRVRARYALAGLPHRKPMADPKEDGVSFPPESFNLTTALHYACGGVSFVHETCVGIRHPDYPASMHDELLDIQMLLYEELLAYALEHPVRWTR